MAQYLVIHRVRSGIT